MKFTSEIITLFSEAERGDDEAAMMLHTALGRRPWDPFVSDCAAAEPHPIIRRVENQLAAYREAHASFLELKYAAGKRSL